MLNVIAITITFLIVKPYINHYTGRCLHCQQLIIKFIEDFINQCPLTPIKVTAYQIGYKPNGCDNQNNNYENPKGISLEYHYHHS